MDKVVDVLAIVIEFLSNKQSILIIICVSIFTIALLLFLRHVFFNLSPFEDFNFIVFSFLPLGFLFLFIIVFIIFFIFSIRTLDFSFFSKDNKEIRKFISYIFGYDVFFVLPTVAIDLLIDTVIKIFVITFNIKKKSDE